METAENNVIEDMKSEKVNVFKVDPVVLEKAMNGELVGTSGCPIPSWDSLKGLTISKINKIKDNLRTQDESEDLYQQSFFGYCYCVRRAMMSLEELPKPIENFTNYYSHFLQSEPLRYIKSSCLNIKIPYQNVTKYQIGDEETFSISLQKQEAETASTEDENMLYLKDLVNKCIKLLTPQEKQLICLKHGIILEGVLDDIIDKKIKIRDLPVGYGMVYTMVDISNIMGIKRGKLNNMESSAMFKMRNYFVKNNIEKDILN